MEVRVGEDPEEGTGLGLAGVVDGEGRLGRSGRRSAGERLRKRRAEEGLEAVPVGAGKREAETAPGIRDLEDAAPPAQEPVVEEAEEEAPRLLAGARGLHRRGSRGNAEEEPLFSPRLEEDAGSLPGGGPYGKRPVARRLRPGRRVETDGGRQGEARVEEEPPPVGEEDRAGPAVPASRGARLEGEAGGRGERREGGGPGVAAAAGPRLQPRGENLPGAEARGGSAERDLSLEPREEVGEKARLGEHPGRVAELLIKEGDEVRLVWTDPAGVEKQASMPVELRPSEPMGRMETFASQRK